MWSVELSKKATKSIRKLPDRIKASLALLLREIEEKGPVRGNRPNYGRLGKKRHHCHLKKGHPTFVAVWEEKESRVNLVEVIYVGSHEKAPY
ncbi:MAG: cytotoxic translational repressor of toxin-antitoxin stability system [Deltaproteobacteria bacterium]|nr:cytotoxic translational repressor of toxin-antitoxin stability system [Deltaproteobacteria bacterium]